MRLVGLGPTLVAFGLKLEGVDPIPVGVDLILVGVDPILVAFGSRLADFDLKLVGSDLILVGPDSKFGAVDQQKLLKKQ